MPSLPSRRTPARKKRQAPAQRIDAGALLSSAFAAHQAGRLSDARKGYAAILAQNPQHADALHLLGLTHMKEGDLPEAERQIRKALALVESPIFLGNLAILLKASQRLDEAEAAYRRALELNPDALDVQFHLGCLLLTLERYSEGWPLYELRHVSWSASRKPDLPQLPYPQWRGEPLAGKSFVVWREQGCGDCIQFVRYVSLLKARGVSRLTVVCSPVMAPLLETVEGVDAVTTRITRLRLHDYWSPVMSLPHYCATTAQTIPVLPMPYVHARAERVARWRERLPAGGLRIGLVWKGNAGHSNDAHRSLPGLEALAPLWSVPGVSFVSLQKGQGEAQAAPPPPAQPLLALGGEVQDFADTAAIVSELDLVICVDTAVAHLAGAMAKPCWVLLPAFGADWRWQLERADSPWYPSMRLFRQPRPGDWGTAVREVVDALMTWRPASSACGPRQLTPIDVDASFKAALAAHQAGRWPQARSGYLEVLAHDAFHADALHLLGLLHFREGDVDQAETLIRRSLTQREHPIVQGNLAAVLRKAGRTADAESAYRRTLALMPDHADAHHGLGELLRSADRLTEAEPLLQRACELLPDHAQAHHDLGLLHLARDRCGQAQASLRRALALQPDHLSATQHLGVLLADANRLGEAQEMFQRALALRPDDADARANLGLLLLTLERYEEGWPLYEARYAPRPGVPARTPALPYPQWRGEPLAGKSISIWPEQGLGDYIQFVRCVALLRQRGVARVTVVCVPSLAALFRDMEGLDAVVAEPQPVPVHDYWSLVLSLPLWCGITADTIPTMAVPYLQASPARVQKWRDRLPAGRPRVGLVWKGSLTPNPARSLPELSCLAPLWTVPDIHFVSLQKGRGEGEALVAPAQQPLVALGTALQDFADTAAVISQLDLVISIDTAVAHLAGAMGKPCWVLLPAVRGDWRWQLKRADSPWYPSMRLFRQQEGTDWGQTVNELARALLAWRSQAQQPQNLPAHTGPAPVPQDIQRTFQEAFAEHTAGRLSAARAGYGAVLSTDPAHADALHLLGLVHAQSGDTVQAERLMRQAIAARDEAVFQGNLGNLLRQMQRPADAETAFRRALQLNPQHVEAHVQLAYLRRAADPQEAEALLRRALSLQPGHLDARLNLANLLQASDRAQQAEAEVREVLALAPDYAPARFNLGNLLRRAARLADSEAEYRHALDIKPDHVEAIINLANVLLLRSRFAEAEAACRRALELSPGHHLARMNLGFALLVQQRYEEAWPYHECRYTVDCELGGVPRPELPFPQWQGEPLAGKSIVVCAEQGFGDCLQFVRYVPLLKARGASRITLFFPEALAGLMRDMEGVDAVATHTSQLGVQDGWVMVASLPMHFNTSVHDIPARQVAYLRAPPGVQKWRDKLPSGSRVGLVWKGNLAPDPRRSLPALTTLAPLWRVPGVSFISLQKGRGEEEAAAPPPGQPLLALGPQLQDFADTAAVISQLDLVISIDTSVAHLAGAMGKPCWLLLPAQGADWRWQSDGAISRWYASVRLFRQSAIDDWTETIEELACALATWRAPAHEVPRTTEQQMQEALAAHKAGRLRQAQEIYESVLAEQAHHADALHLLGLVHLHQGRWESAEELIGRAIAQNENAVYLVNLAELYRKTDRIEKARETLRGAIALAPAHADAHFYLGYLLGESDAAAAQASLRRALELQPDHVLACCKLANLLKREQRFDDAEALYGRALARDAGCVEAWVNLGNLKMHCARFEQAQADYERALALDPDHALARMNLGILHLAQGRYVQAWPLYESRYAAGMASPLVRVPQLPFPPWRGEPLVGKSLLIYAEQGFGDCLQFVRYASLLKQRGARRLTLVCSPSLRDLLATVPGLDEVLAAPVEPRAHDYWSFLLSLPLQCQTTPDTIPISPIPYVHPQAARIAHWRGRLPAGAARVGLVWRGTPGHANDANRSLPGLECLAPLWDVPGVSFVSLQKGAGEDQACAPPAGLPLVDLGSKVRDFADTAAIVSALDLVICVDTSIAHLAGAMGKPCWVLLPALGTDWRWQLKDESSPWYPSLRLFRQKTPGGWDAVVRELARALMAWRAPPPSHPARLKAAIELLAGERYAQAWPLYESRLAEGNATGISAPKLQAPQWQGQPLEGKSFVIWPEQGYGDYIQFVRYAKVLKARGVARLAVVCPPPLAALVATVEGVDTVVTDLSHLPAHHVQAMRASVEVTDDVSPPDYWSFLMSLPLHCGTTVDSLPLTPTPYLRAPQPRVDLWRPRLPREGLKVGLVWKGRPDHLNDGNRSLPGLACLAPLWSVGHVSFISLQKGEGESGGASASGEQPLLQLGMHIEDFADTAAIISQLDLVISVDTSVAHLAGALGKPCWILLPATGTDWRWHQGRADSPWYPSVRLFRQARPGDWAEPVAAVASALGALAARRALPGACRSQAQDLAVDHQLPEATTRLSSWISPS